MSILVYRDEKQEGPYDFAEIEKGLNEGRFSLEDLAWKEGCTEWVPLQTLLPAPPELPRISSQAAQEKINFKVDHSKAALAQFLGDEQDAGVVEKILRKANDLLTRGENVEYIGVQKKPLINIAPDAVLLTNKRFMIVRPKLLGMTFEDHVWREVENVHMSEQILTATITCDVVGNRQLRIDSIPKRQARKIYAYAQEMEEQMHEERRKRSMEEKRAGAGGVVIQSPIGMPVQPAVSAGEDPMATLGKLKKMLDAGLIEASEYDAKKAEILSRM